MAEIIAKFAVNSSQGCWRKRRRLPRSARSALERRQPQERSRLSVFLPTWA